MGTLGIYIQIPFCASKCSFCNFSSRVAPSTVFDGYCHALEREAQKIPEFYKQAGIDLGILSLPVDALYLGGGTPPIVGIERLRRIVEAARSTFGLDSLQEFTMEVTPGSVKEETLQGLRELGVNRLSIGAQTFNDEELRSVGRLHTAGDTEQMIAAARRTGFTNISLDLIAGLPHQSVPSWRRTLKTVAELRPEHVSVYIFEVDEKSRLGGEVIRHGTRFHADALPDEEFAAEAYEEARLLLSSKGCRQYEISNFALPGNESLHNRKYWRLEPYVGLGAGAHSFSGERRWANETSPAVYAERLSRGEPPITENYRLETIAQIEEFFFLGLRQAEGVNLAIARQRWGDHAIQAWEPVVAGLSERGLVQIQDAQLRLAEQAYLVSNEVFQEFLLAHEEVR